MNFVNYYYGIEDLVLQGLWISREKFCAMIGKMKKIWWFWLSSSNFVRFFGFNACRLLHWTSWNRRST